ncbi:hypothetical protein Q0812_10280 [Brevundimonas sp. 2R-24]|uniref:Uncharacterized protein n=1 Tax=Peiella sedimenti TaxID=3061083 RepID=A0ABT8SML6_9CAUL|nr:hypothetical protein [Caulobacteraceae bacterium XZ-24]
MLTTIPGRAPFIWTFRLDEPELEPFLAWVAEAAPQARCHLDETLKVTLADETAHGEFYGCLISSGWLDGKFENNDAEDAADV